MWECVVVDVGATEIRAGISSSAMPSVSACTATSDSHTLITQVAEMIGALLRQYPKLAANIVSVGCPGVVRDGVVERALYLPLTGVDVAAELKCRIGAAVTVSNDVDAQAVGAMAVPSRSYFVIAVGTAVGGAYVADGELQQGRVGSIAEIGHLPVGVTSERCECGGVGCLDTAVAGWALDRKLGPVWWAQPSPEADAALHMAGAALSRAARAVGTLYDVDYVLMLGKVFGFAVLWKGFYSEHAGLGADVPITASQSTWGYAARGLGRIAQRHGE